MLIIHAGKYDPRISTAGEWSPENWQPARVSVDNPISASDARVDLAFIGAAKMAVGHPPEAMQVEYPGHDFG
jgi:hypothetical protein